MRALLVPDRNTAYGQDFLSNAIARRCALKKTKSSIDSLEALVNASLVISQNPDSDEDASLIEGLAAHTSVAIHVHCQYSYFSEAQQINLARCAAKASTGVTPAEFTTEDMRRRYPNVTWHTVHNGIDTRRFFPIARSKRLAWRRRWDIPPDAPVVAFVGRLEPAKGLEVLRAFCDLAAAARIHVLVQYLANTEAKVLERYCRVAKELENVGRGYVHLFPDTDLRSPRPIRYCDALLTPSLSEVAPLVALEAFHCGLPIVGTKSTRFYDELPAIGIPPSEYHLVAIPEAADCSGPRSTLKFGETCAEEVARHLIDIMLNLELPSDAKRKAASARAGATNLVLDQMLTQLCGLYPLAT